MSRCVIISACPVTPELAKALRPDDFIIACDAGYRNCVPLGCKPDIILGDFDTAPCPEKQDDDIIVLPHVKDDTDTEYAAKLASEKGFDEVLLLGGLTGLFMILVARPAAVFLSLLPFRKFTTRARLYVSWVGLRGAVPIIFATYPVVAGVEDSSLLFNIVFFVTLLSLVVQGTTVSLMAEWLGLAYPERERIFNDEVMNRMLDDATTELTVTEAMLESGHHLRDIVLPAATLVVMVARDGTFFVPKGNSVLRVGDKLLVVTENKSEVKSVVQPQE